MTRPVDHRRSLTTPTLGVRVAHGAPVPARACRRSVAPVDHPLATVLAAAVAGRFPAADGGVEVLPTDNHGTSAVVAMTGHAYVLADVDSDELKRQIPDGTGGFGGALHPDVLRWLAGSDRHIGSVDVVLAARGVGGAATPATPIDGVLAEHRRVVRALRHRRDVEVVVEPDGVVVLGRGLVGRAGAVGRAVRPIGDVHRRRATADRCRTAVRPGGRVVLGPGRSRQRPLPSSLPGLRVHPDRFGGVAHLI